VKKRWLRDLPWETVVVINAGLCKEKAALPKPTSDGFKPAEKLWNESRKREITLRETFEVCRQRHKLAPFCFYNGNTFVAIGRTLIQHSLGKLPPLKAHSLRSVVGHHIAGTAGSEELGKALEGL
jgi:hypothetical protein